MRHAGPGRRGTLRSIRELKAASVLPVRRAISLEAAYTIVLVGYLTGISSFSRDFARLHASVSGIPLFAGEVAITLLMVLQLALFVRDRRSPIEPDVPSIALIGYLMIGSVFAVWGLVQGYGLAALRDFALVYYLAFFFFSLAFFHVGGKPTGLISTIALWGMLGSALSAIRFVVSPHLTWEHGLPGHQALLAWMAAIYLVLSFREARGTWIRVLYLVGLAVCMFVIYLAAYRTMLVVMLASVFLLWAWGILRNHLGRRRDLQSAVAATLVVGAMIVAVTGHSLTMIPPEDALPVNGPIALGDAFKVLSARWVRGFLSVPLTLASEMEQPTLDPAVTPEDAGVMIANTPVVDVEGSLAFRATLWRAALGRIQSSSMLGMGFGPPPDLYPDDLCDVQEYPLSNCGNAHNSYLTLALRMGIPVLVMFIGINGLILYRFLSALRGWSGSPEDYRTAVLTLVVYVSFALYAFMSLFFESPYLSSLYWVVLAVMYHFGSHGVPWRSGETDERSRPGPERLPGSSQAGSHRASIALDSGAEN